MKLKKVSVFALAMFMLLVSGCNFAPIVNTPVDIEPLDTPEPIIMPTETPTIEPTLEPAPEPTPTPKVDPIFPTISMSRRDHSRSRYTRRTRTLSTQRYTSSTGLPTAATKPPTASSSLPTGVSAGTTSPREATFSLRWRTREISIPTVRSMPRIRTRGICGRSIMTAKRA